MGKVIEKKRQPRDKRFRQAAIEEQDRRWERYGLREDGNIHVSVTETINMRNAGTSPVRELLRLGYKIDEDSRTPDGQSFEMYIPFDVWKERVYDPSKRRSKALQGLGASGAVKEVSAEDDSVSAAKELAAAAGHDG